MATDATHLAVPIANTAPLQEQQRLLWLKIAAQQMAAKLELKFIAGQREHKADLGEVTVLELLNEMEAEALDQLSYVTELKRRLGVSLAAEGMAIMRKASELGLDSQSE